MSGPDANSTQIHGTCVAVDGRAAVFIGASGTGKSATALRMVASGARLVADDQVILTRKGDDIVATCPKGFAGLIEARGIGLLTVPHADTAIVDVIVDMEQTELHRLPPKAKSARQRKNRGCDCRSRQQAADPSGGQTTAGKPAAAAYCR